MSLAEMIGRYGLTRAAAGGLTAIDEQGLVEGTNVGTFHHRPIQNSGPFNAVTRLWVFYSDGTNVVYKSKPASGGSWSGATTVTDSGANTWVEDRGWEFDYVIDGSHVHLMRESAGDIYYLRGTLDSGGTITFGAQQLAWDSTAADEGNNVYSAGGDGYMGISVFSGTPFLTFQATDGTNYKPIATASSDASGGWTRRTAFPDDLATATANNSNGRDNGSIAMSSTEVMFWYRPDTNDLSARVWTDAGGIGAQEDTGAAASTIGETGAVVPETGVVVVHRLNDCRFRNSSGAWSNIAANGLGSSDNTLTNKGNAVRAWDISTADIRYDELTADDWQAASPVFTWGGATVYHSNATNNPDQLAGTHADIDDGDAHAVTWIENGDLWYGMTGDVQE